MALFCKRQTDQKDRPKSLALKNLENPKTPQKSKILQNPKILSHKNSRLYSSFFNIIMEYVEFKAIN